MSNLPPSTGECLCLMSSIPWVDPDYISSDAKYYLALVGQALTGMAAPFITCLPTKISQHWFGNNFQVWSLSRFEGSCQFIRTTCIKSRPFPCS